MGKIVAIAGNTGAGKTTFAAALGSLLARDGKHVLLISPDTRCPLLGMLLSKGRDLESLGKLLITSELNASFLAQHVAMSQESNNLALLGYLATDKVDDYDAINERQAWALLSAAAELADITIIDGSDYGDSLSEAAVRSADILISIVESDYRGLTWIKSSNLSFLRGKNQERLFLSFTRNLFDPKQKVFEALRIEAFSEIPFTDEAHRKFVDGQLLEPYQNKQYRITLKKVAEAIGSPGHDQ